jgi:zinc protease
MNKTGNRDQGSEIREQRSENRDQRTEIRDQRSENRDQESESLVTRHDFSRADKTNKMTGALAPEGRSLDANSRVSHPHSLRQWRIADYFARSANMELVKALAVKTFSRKVKGAPPPPPCQPLCHCATVQRPAFQPHLLALLAGFAIAITIPSPLAAQQSKPWEKIPIPPLHEFHPQQPKRIELKNGIVVFLQEDHELPFVSGSVLIPGGSRDVDQKKAGLIDLYEEAWRTSGSDKMSGDAMDDFLEARAAHIETGGEDDSTAVEWDSLKGDADQVFDLAMALLFHPKFSEEKLALAKQQEATGIIRRNDDEAGIAEREGARLIYGADSPYTRQPEFATMGSVTVADLQAWHDQSLKGKLIVAISGDFDAASIETKVRAAFESLPPVTPAPPRHDITPGPTPGVYFINKPDVDQSNVEILGLGTDRHNPDAATITVLDEILGGGFGSRLFQTVRTKLGLAYAVSGGISMPYDHVGGFMAEVLTKSVSTVDATKAAMEVIDGMNTTPITDDELRRAKDGILNSFLFEYDTKDKVLAEREKLEFYGYPADYLETYKSAIEKVTVADVTAAAKRYIHPEKLAILVVGNESEIKPPLVDLNLGAVKPIDIAIPRPQMPPGAAGGPGKQE